MFSNFSFKVSEDKVYDTIEFNEFLQVTITRGAAISVSLFKRENDCLFDG